MGFETVLHGGPALRDILGGRGVAVAVGWRVDEAEDAVGLARALFIVEHGSAAVRGAQVDGRIVRQAAAAQDVVELGAIVIREEDVVPGERKALGARRQHPRQGRQGAVLTGGRCEGGIRSVCRHAAGERNDVSVPDDRVGFNQFAGGEAHAGGFIPIEHDRIDWGLRADDRAACGRQIREGLGECAHAPVDAPDTGLLDVGDEHQSGRRLERGGAAVSRVAAEELLQPGIAEVGAERRPERGVG